MRDACQRLDLRLVGEKDVDASLVEKLIEAVAMAVDAEGVRQGESDLAAGLASDLDRADHRIAGRFRVPEIAFEVEDRAVADLRSSNALAGRCCAAPRKVFMVRCPSGVTRIIERAVGEPTSVAGVMNSTPVDVRSCR